MKILFHEFIAKDITISFGLFIGYRNFHNVFKRNLEICMAFLVGRFVSTLSLETIFTCLPEIIRFTSVLA